MTPGPGRSLSSRRRILLAAGVWLLGAVAAVAVAAAPVVENPDTPAHGRRTLELQEQWRIGGIDDEETLIGVISQAAVDADDNVYLLDAQLVTVLIYDAQGRFVGQVGREGDGPGEIHRPTGVVLMPDGTVGLVQGFPGRIVKVALDGTPAGQINPGGAAIEGGFFTLRRAAVAGSSLYLTGALITRDDTRRTIDWQLSRCDGEGNTETVYAELTDRRDFASMRRDETSGYFPNTWTVSADGRVWVPPTRNEYRIDVYEKEGELSRSITRAYESWERTGEEIERTRQRMTPQGRGRRAQREWEVVVEPTERDVMQLRVDPEGRLWVLSSRGAHPQEAGIHSVWDVFDAEGRFDEQVALVCDGRPLRDGIAFPGRDIVLVIKNLLDAEAAFRGVQGDEESDAGDAPIEVICYRLPPRATD